MIAIAVLVVVVAVAAGVFLSLGRRGRATGAGQWRRSAGTSPAEEKEKTLRAAARPGGPGLGTLAGDLSRWTGAGLITAEQADAIAGFERSAGAGAVGGERRVSLLAEALGYVGVVLALAGAAVGLAQGWDDLPVWARLAIPAAVTGLLLVGGFLLRKAEEPAFRRLMSVLWVLAVGGLAWTLAVLGIEVIDWDSAVTGEPIALMTAGGCTVLAGVLYLLRRHGLQQAALLASLHGLVVSSLLVALPDTDPPMWWFAVAVWLLGLSWAALGWRGIVEPGWLAVSLGCVGAVVGPAFGLGDYEWLLAPALLTSAALMTVSVPTRQTPLLALGTLGAFGYITWAVVTYFGDSLGVPVALVIVGAVFLALAVLAGVLATKNRGKPARFPE
jgi:hypothetical protein